MLVLEPHLLDAVGLWMKMYIRLVASVSLLGLGQWADGLNLSFLYANCGNLASAGLTSAQQSAAPDRLQLRSFVPHFVATLPAAGELNRSAACA